VYFLYVSLASHFVWKPNYERREGFHYEHSGVSKEIWKLVVCSFRFIVVLWEYSRTHIFIKFLRIIACSDETTPRILINLLQLGKLNFYNYVFIRTDD
jgi:hypothetical protein